MNSSLKKTVQHHNTNKKQGEFKKDNFTHTQIAPVNAIPSSTEVQQRFYNANQPWPNL